MARKRRKDNEEARVSYDYSKNGGNGSVGLSAEAQRALDTGSYGSMNTRKAQYNTSQEQTQQAKSLPVLKGISIPESNTDAWESNLSKNKSYIDTDRARRNYEQKIGHVGTGLTQEDSDTLYKIFDKNRLSSGGNSAIVHQLKNNIWLNTKDWEDKYGKSLEQIVDDYSKDYEKIAEQKNIQKGKENKISTTLGNVFRGGTVEPALDLESTILGKIAPNTEITKAVRNATEKYSKQKSQTKEGVTENMPGWAKEGYEFGTNMAERAIRYANPSALKYALTFGKTSENERQNLKERGIEGTSAEVQSGLAGLTDAALDAIGFESIPALKGLTQSGNLGKEILGRFLIGGGEQWLTEAINRKADRLINGDKSLHSVAVQNYIAQGMTEEEAESQANKDEAVALAEATVSGGLLNNIIGLGGKAVSKAINKVPSLAQPKVSDISDQLTDDLTIASKQANNGEFGVKHMDKLTENDARVSLDKRGKLTKILEENPQIKRHIDGELKSPEHIESEINDLYRQMDDYAHGRMRINDLFDCGETPAVLKESGVKGNRIKADQSIYDKITIPEGYVKNKNGVDYHGLGKDGFEKIVRGLNDPAVTLQVKNKKGEDAVNAIINYTSNSGEPVLVAVTLGKDGTISNIEDISGASKIMTAHIRSGLDNYLVNNAKGIKYIKGDDNSVSNALRFDALESSSPDDVNIPPVEENVNKVVYEDAGLSNPKLTGEVPKTDVSEVPPEGDEKIRSFSRRGSEDESLPEEIRNTLSEDYYKVVHNAETESRAESMFDGNDLIQTRSNLDRAVEAHDPASALLSYKLAKAYVDNGNYDAATDVLQNVSAELTRMGQFTQAAKLAMLQNDPMAAMRSYMRDLEKLNEWGKKKYKGKWNNLELSEDDIKLINSVQKGDSEGLNNVIDQLNTKFSKQIPANWWDKAVTASKTAMLLNPRTQSRNILANMATLPIRSAADRVSAVGQNIAHLINPDTKVTQSVTGGTKEQKSIAKQIWEQRKDSILGENKMKDSVKSDILSQRQIFNDDFFAKWIDNATNGGIQKLNEKLGANGNQSTMETLTNFTYWLMGDLGDTPFVKKNFVNRLASYMKAQGINNIEDVPNDAIAIATQEALKATFKDDNAFTKALQGIKQKSGKFGEVALPFVKTPANLTMRAIDYSPAGLINTFRKIKSGAEANAVIDELSKNLTGSAMIYLGYKLAEKGLLSGSYSKDADEAAWQKQQGFLENAIHVPKGVPVIGDKYVTYDWTQPAATPLVLGQTIYEAVKASDNENADILDIINATYKGGLKTANTIINSSPLQSLSDLLGDSPYSDEGVAENIANEILEFPQRFIPSILGATARTIDPTMRDTYVKDSTLTGAIGNQVRSAMAKVPGLSKTLPAAYDTWGNERTRSDSAGQAFLAQMVNPGQFGNKNETPLDAEIQRIFDETGNNAVFPLYAPRSLDLGNDGNITLTNKQHSDYQKAMGQRSYSYAENLINNPEYKNLTDDEKAKAFEKAYKLSNALVKEEMFNHVTDSDKKLKEVARNGSAKDVAQYIIDSSIASSKGMTVDKYLKSKNGQTVETKPKTTQTATPKVTAKSEPQSQTVPTIEKNEHYDKVMARAGSQSSRMETDLPKLRELGLPDSADYVYANAINKNPSITVPEFTQTYNEINTNKSDKLTQKELLAYVNEYQFDDDPDKDMQIVTDYWNTYQDGTWKKSIYRKKDGTYGAK